MSAESVSSSTAAPLPPARGPTRRLTGRDNRGGRSVILSQPGGYSAEILFNGAQVVSWKNEHKQELLFLSKQAVYKPPQPVRGGIPFCFPKYGFARIRLWGIENLKHDTAFPPPTPDNAYADFFLILTPDKFPDWLDHRLELRLRVILGPTGDLTMTTRIKNVNTNGEPFTFKFAYHTYFSVSNIRLTRIEGLQTLDYRDYVEGVDNNQFTEEADAITFKDRVDRVYMNTPDEIRIRDLELRRVITIHKDAGLPDIVVWNPWEFDASIIADLGDEEYKEMVCVQAAAMENEITLNPNEEWTATQRLSAEEYSDVI
ncbi:hypothetical protein ABFX02_11G062100 [Erythranthe guttata]